MGVKRTRMEGGFTDYRHWTSPISSLDFTLDGQTIVTGPHPLSSPDLTLDGNFHAKDLHFRHPVTTDV